MNITFSTQVAPLLNHLKDQLFTTPLQRKVAFVALAILSALAAVYWLCCCRLDRRLVKPDPKAHLSALLEETRKQVLSEFGGFSGMEKMDSFKFFIDVTLSDKTLFSEDYIYKNGNTLFGAVLKNSFAHISVPLSAGDEDAISKDPNQLLVSWYALVKGKNSSFQRISGSKREHGEYATKASLSEKGLVDSCNSFLERTNREVKPQYDGHEFI